MDSFKGKKILLICKESYSFPLYYLAQRWKDNNEVSAFFFNAIEAKFAKCKFNEQTYYRWKAINSIKVYDSIKIADIFVNQKEDQIENYEFLQNIEEEYTHYLGINEQIMTTQYLTRYYHYRNYYRKCTYTQQLNWVTLNYENILEIIKDASPDVVFDLDNSELARTILLEICYKDKIPYITLDFPRYDLYKTATFSLGRKVDPFFELQYNKFKAYSKVNLKKEYDYIEKFRESAQITTQEYKSAINEQYKSSGLRKTIKKLLVKAIYLNNQDRAGNNRKIKRTSKILYNNSRDMFNYFASIELRKQILTRSNCYFTSPAMTEKYIYMPLHLIPESSTFTLAPFYVNELSIIEAVSKSLPAGWWLYVKEHPAMLGEREIKFYKQVNSLPNVKMVQFNYYDDPKPWITNSQGVATISGTTAFEAALLGKPSVIFADVPFKLIDGVTRVRSFEDLPGLFRQFRRWEEDNTHSCAAYIRAVKEIGVEFNANYMLEEGEKIANGQAEISEEFERQIDNLEKLYVDAYNRYPTLKELL